MHICFCIISRHLCVAKWQLSCFLLYHIIYFLRNCINCERTHIFSLFLNDYGTFLLSYKHSLIVRQIFKIRIAASRRLSFEAVPKYTVSMIVSPQEKNNNEHLPAWSDSYNYWYLRLSLLIHKLERTFAS